MGGLVCLLLALLLLYFLVLQLWRPMRIQRRLRRQGVRGPRYWPIIGSLGELANIYAKAGRAPPPPPPSESHPYHKVLQLALPHLEIWREKYGRVMLYWYGRSPRLSVTDPELIKELSNNPRKYEQSIQHPLFYQLLGKSILAVGGENWVSQRRILNPFFHMESIKGMSGIVVSAMEERMESWSRLMEPNGLEIDIHKEFESLSQYVIAKMIFGDDVEEGLPIVQMQGQQVAMASQIVKIFYIPGSRFVPTPLSRRTKALRRQMERQFTELINKRLFKDVHEKKDWLALMLSSNIMSRQQIIDECCTILAAGSESTNLLLSWACILLGIHIEWQDRAREEIHQVLKGRSRPTAEILSRLKFLNMIINETLRLYPPIPFVMKTTEEEMKVGSLIVPAGTDVEVPLVGVHHDQQQWGDNVDQFDPSRFSEGVANASKHPMAFMPFMQGPRICIGMNFAMIEARITLAMVLQNFSWVLSPHYKHEPVCGITLKPGKGAHVILHSI